MANVHHLTSSLFTPTATPATLYPAFKSRQRRSAAAATTWRMHAINPLGVGFSIAKTIFESPRGSEVLWGGGPGVRTAAQKRVHNSVKFANSAIKNYVYVVVWGIFKSTFLKYFCHSAAQAALFETISKKFHWGNQCGFSKWHVFSEFRALWIAKQDLNDAFPLPSHFCQKAIKRCCPSLLMKWH